MTNKPKAVQVVEYTDNGIRAVIYGKDMCWNKSKDQYFALVNGKWMPCKATAKQQEILKDRHESKMWKQERIKSASAEPRRYSQAYAERQAFLAQERNA